MESSVSVRCRPIPRATPPWAVARGGMMLVHVCAEWGNLVTLEPESRLPSRRARCERSIGGWGWPVYILRSAGATSPIWWPWL